MATNTQSKIKKELPSDPTKDSLSTQELVRLLLATQQASILQSQAAKKPPLLSA
jgi:hypothetical protein